MFQFGRLAIYTGTKWFGIDASTSGWESAEFQLLLCYSVASGKEGYDSLAILRWGYNSCPVFITGFVMRIK